MFRGGAGAEKGRENLVKRKEKMFRPCVTLEKAVHHGEEKFQIAQCLGVNHRPTRKQTAKGSGRSGCCQSPCLRVGGLKDPAW